MKKDNTNGRSREEILESILEETARNPYKPGSYKRRATAERSAERPAYKPAYKPAEKTPYDPSGVMYEPREKSVQPEQKQVQSDSTQVFSAQSNDKNGVPDTDEITRVMSREEIAEAANAVYTSAETPEDKIRRIQKEKAAAAKAAIMQKAEIENARHQQFEENRQAFSMLDDEDEKVNIIDSFEATGEQQKAEKCIVTEACRLFQTCVLILFTVYMIFGYVLGYSGVVGDSMSPTVSDGDKLIFLNAGYTPAKGDVVVIYDKTAALLNENGSVTEKDGLDCKIIKRVIATGGDTVDIDFEKGIVTVNGEELKESYISEPTTRDEGAFEYPITIPDGYVYVLGDNRGISKDSRHSDVGLVPEDEVIGKALLRIYPFGDFGTVE